MCIDGIGNASQAASLAQMLLSKGADVRTRCRWTDMSALHYAAFFNVGPVIDILLEAASGESSSVQWNLSIKDTLNKEHLSNEDSVCCPNHIELCINLPLN